MNRLANAWPSIPAHHVVTPRETGSTTSDFAECGAACRGRWARIGGRVARSALAVAVVLVVVAVVAIAIPAGLLFAVLDAEERR